MTPAVLTSPTATIAQAARATAPAWRLPLTNRGVTTRSTTAPSTNDWPTVARAYTIDPATAIANGRGCRATWAPITRRPRRSRRPWGVAVTTPWCPTPPRRQSEFPSGRVGVEPEVGDVGVAQPGRERPVPDPRRPEERLPVVDQRRPGRVLH